MRQLTAAELVRTFHGEGELAASTGALFLPPLDDLLWQRERLAAGRRSGDGPSGWITASGLGSNQSVAKSLPPFTGPPSLRA